MKTRKIYVIGGSSVALMIACVLVLFMVHIRLQAPMRALDAYAHALNEKEYTALYATVDTRITKEEFVKQMKQVYRDIKMKNFTVTINDCKRQDGKTILHYNVRMDTIAGRVHYKNTVAIVKKNGKYKMRWDRSQIYPTLHKDTHIAIRTLMGQRGSIFDRNGVALASQGSVFRIGLVAGYMNNKVASYKALANVLDMEYESVQAKMSAKWIKKGMFVPVKTIDAQQKNKLNDALHRISGISIQKSSARIYPYGDMCAHITGYVQTISAQERKEHAKDDYAANSFIGKTGLEQVFEKDLRAKKGYAIDIVDDENNYVSTIAKKEAIPGKDITTTIDIRAQKAVYDQLKNDKGAGIMLDAHTGEVLAMVSMPAFDPNDFVLGITTKQWNTLANSAATPLMDRVTSTYAPGSTFKAITGAIGLDSHTITPDTTRAKCDRWQKDASWGAYYVTTTQAYPEPSNLANAYKYSDNIYFAQLANAIGVKTFSKYLDQIGFHSKIDFPFAVQQASYGAMDNDQTLAATGFGQGQLQISPLQLCMLYTAYKNDGSILQPYLIYDGHKQKIYKKNAYRKDTATTVFNDLQKTMDYYGENPTHAAGKTGTAQAKNGKQEIGWLCAINDKISITLMIDDTKNIGESRYIIPKMHAVLQNYS